MNARVLIPAFVLVAAPPAFGASPARPGKSQLTWREIGNALRDRAASVVAPPDRVGASRSLRGKLERFLAAKPTSEEYRAENLRTTFAELDAFPVGELHSKFDAARGLTEIRYNLPFLTEAIEDGTQRLKAFSIERRGPNVDLGRWARPSRLLSKAQNAKLGAHEIGYDSLDLKRLNLPAESDDGAQVEGIAASRLNELTALKKDLQRDLAARAKAAFPVAVRDAATELATRAGNPLVDPLKVRESARQVLGLVSRQPKGSLLGMLLAHLARTDPERQAAGMTPTLIALRSRALLLQTPIESPLRPALESMATGKLEGDQWNHAAAALVRALAEDRTPLPGEVQAAIADSRLVHLATADYKTHPEYLPKPEQISVPEREKRSFGSYFSRFPTEGHP